MGVVIDYLFDGFAKGWGIHWVISCELMSTTTNLNGKALRTSWPIAYQMADRCNHLRPKILQIIK